MLSEARSRIASRVSICSHLVYGHFANVCLRRRHSDGKREPSMRIKLVLVKRFVWATVFYVSVGGQTQWLQSASRLVQVNRFLPGIPPIHLNRHW